MSRIYFHSSDDTAKVRGSERAHFGIYCHDTAWQAVSNLAEEHGNQKSILRNAFPPGHYVLESRNFAETAGLHFRVGSEPLILDGQKIPMFTLALNTAYYMGSDFVKLAARLHGQCELHAYVEGKNRAWLAGIIQKGRACRFFRDGEGWESVIELLEKSNDSPIVTSFSVSSSFPNPDVANFEYPELEDGDLDWDAWYNVPDSKQWEMGVEGLRQRHGGKLEMKPDDWETFYFGNGFCANQLVSALYELYFEKEVEPEGFTVNAN